MKPKNFSFFIPFMLFTMCAPKTERAIVVSQVKSVAKLASVEFVVSKLIQSAKDGSLSLGKATFMAQTEATITAGIDLNDLLEEDIKIDNNKINILLPPIEIINFSYPAEKFKEMERYTKNEFWAKITVEDKDELYRQGELAIREQAEELGIAKTGEEHLRKLLTPILETLGFDEIYIRFKPSPDKIMSAATAL
jgi:hypothetical protein